MLLIRYQSGQTRWQRSSNGVTGVPALLLTRCSRGYAVAHARSPRTASIAAAAGAEEASSTWA